MRWNEQFLWYLYLQLLPAAGPTTLMCNISLQSLNGRCGNLTCQISNQFIQFSIFKSYCLQRTNSARIIDLTLKRHGMEWSPFILLSNRRSPQASTTVYPRILRNLNRGMLLPHYFTCLGKNHDDNIPNSKHHCQDKIFLPPVGTFLR